MKPVRKEKSKEGISYWLSYSDMMAALLLVFSLIIAITMYVAACELTDEKKRYEGMVNDYQTKMEDYQTKMEYMDGLKSELEKTSGQLEEIIGVRKDIIQKLFDEFDDEGDMKIDRETGDIIFSSQILFDLNKDTLKEDGKAFLNDFFPRYLSILMSDGIKEHISEIIVEGHTDPQAENPRTAYLKNMELSQRRSYAVVNYCMSNSGHVLTPEEISYLETVLSANGKSYSELIYTEDGKVDNDSSRRVEIKFRIADEGQIETIIEMMQEQLDGDNVSN